VVILDLWLGYSYGSKTKKRGMGLDIYTPLKSQPMAKKFKKNFKRI